MLRNETRKVHHVKGLECSFVKGKDMILRPKANIFEKHVGKTRLFKTCYTWAKKGEWYVNKKCNHAKNEVVFFKKSHHNY